MKESPSAYLAEEISLSDAIKREASSQQDEKDDPKAPDISCKARVLLLLYYLRCHVGWCPTKYPQFLSVCFLDTEAKVYEFDVVAVIDQDVF